MNIFFKILIPLFLFTSSTKLSAQFRIVPLQHGKVAEKEAAYQRRADIPLSLPFWDDFSTSSYRPDTSKWNDNSGVFINSGLAISPPSINVATFDGLSQNGTAYAQSPLAKGLADSLVSKPIDLGSLTAIERNTVFLSFFWQLKGNGEQPDYGDSLVLQFKNNANQWITQWPLNEAKKEVFNVRTDTFYTEMIQVTDNFLHDRFQFRIMHYSRLSGAFDTWHIDYIYLNKNRTANYTAFDDRAISSSPTSILKGYSSVPAEVFFKNPAEYLQPTSVKVTNLHDTLQPVTFSAAIKYSGENVSKTIILNDDEELTEPGPILFPFRRGKAISSIPPASAFEPSADSVLLETTFSIKSGDYIYFKDIDARVNDTATTSMTLHNFYAYDDGSGEFGAGLNLAGGRIAYKYVIPEQDTLTHIDIYFATLGRSNAGSTVRLFVAKKLDNAGDELLFKETNIVQTSSELNQLRRYELTELLVVKDTIYIGFEQDVDDFLPVGLDKDNDSGDKIYVYDQDGWEQNKQIVGSLMMRPVFGKPNPSLIIDPTGIKDKIGYLKLSAFPNPTSGLVYIDVQPDEIYALDIVGRKYNVQHRKLADEKSEVDLSTLNTGIYFLYAKKKDKIYIQKIILK